MKSERADIRRRGAGVIHCGAGKELKRGEGASAVVEEPEGGVDFVGEEVGGDDPAAERRLVGLPNRQAVDCVAAFLAGRFGEDSGGDSAVVFDDAGRGLPQTWRHRPSEDEGRFRLEADDETEQTDHGKWE